MIPLGSRRHLALRRARSTLERLGVPSSATARLAGLLRGSSDDNSGVAFDVGGVRIWAPQRFVANFVDREYEPGLTRLLRETLSENAVVIDAGAHVGYLSILMARAVGASGRVFAIEPSLENVDYLRRNLAANGVKNVHVLAVALTSQPGLVSFHLNASSDSYGLFDHPNTATTSIEMVPAMSLDALFGEFDLDRLDLVKIDTEGAEIEVLQGMGALSRNSARRRVVSRRLRQPGSDRRCASPASGEPRAVARGAGPVRRRSGIGERGGAGAQRGAAADTLVLQLGRTSHQLSEWHRSPTSRGERPAVHLMGRVIASRIRNRRAAATLLDDTGRVWMGRVRGVRSATAWALLGLVLYATMMVVVATRSGLGISVDSVYYAHGGDSFARTGEVSAFGLPLTLWPVGYPIFLGLSLRLGVDPQTTALVLNLLSVAATVVLTYFLGRNLLGSARAGLVAAAIVALSSSTVRVFAMLWTEPPFTALVLGVLVLLVRAVGGRDLGWGTALGIGLLVSLATTLRYVGVVLVPVVVLGVLLALWTRGRGRALLTAALAGSTASIGLALLVGRNLGLGVAPLGDRTAGGLPLTNVVGHSLRALGRYVVPETGGLMPLGGDPSGTAYLVVTGATIGLGVLVALFLVVGAWSAFLRRHGGLVVLTFFVVAWWGALAYSTTATGVDPPNERLLAPVFAPMVVLALEGGRRLAAATRSRAGWVRLWGTRTLSVLSVGLLALTLVAGVVVGGGASFAASRSGIGYNADEARTSPLGQALRQLPAGSTVAASDPWLAWWVARKDTTTIYDAALKEKVSTRQVNYLAFFTASTADHRTPAALESEGVTMRLVASYADGSLYEAVATRRSG